VASAKSRSRTPRAGNAAAATSSVQKACRILRAMSDARTSRLTDIASAAGLDKATALRLLDMLARDGFVARDAETKQYSLGAELFVLGAAALARFDPRPAARPSLLRLADAFEDTAILSIPSGAESICVDVEAGRFPIRANYLEVGSRRPLGVGAGSLALLAWMGDREVEAVMPAIAARLGRYPRITTDLLLRHVAAARERGYAVLLDVVVERMGGIAAPIMGRDGRPVAALSVAALSDRITERERLLAVALKREAAACEAQWHRAAVTGGAIVRTRRLSALRPDLRQ
jgi:DNA-binding IclR family transcriptional regulator